MPPSYGVPGGPIKETRHLKMSSFIRPAEKPDDGSCWIDLNSFCSKTDAAELDMFVKIRKVIWSHSSNSNEYINILWFTKRWTKCPANFSSTVFMNFLYHISMAIFFIHIEFEIWLTHVSLRKKSIILWFLFIFIELEIWLTHVSLRKKSIILGFELFAYWKANDTE